MTLVLFSFRQCCIHPLPVCKTCDLILQLASQIESPFPFLLFQGVFFVLFCLFFFFFLQTLNPVARFLSEVEKFFSSPKFLPSSLLNWRDECGRDKAQKGKRLLTRLLKAQELVLSLSFCSFSRYRLLKKRLRIKCKLRSGSFKKHQWGPCGEAALLRFSQLLKKWEIGAFSSLLSELLTVSSCSVCADRNSQEYVIGAEFSVASLQAH